MTAVTKEREVHKTEYVDKELPKITYQRAKTQTDITIIEVTDKSSKEAFETFKKVRKEIENEQ